MKTSVAGVLLTCLVTIAHGQSAPAKEKMPWEMTPEELSAAVSKSKQPPPAPKGSVTRDFHFAVRCSQEPKLMGIGTMQSKLTDMLYLKWTGDELTHQHYSVSTDNPERTSETPNVYKPSKGKESVAIASNLTTMDSGKFRHIDVSLKSNADNALASLVGSLEPVSDGKWRIEIPDTGPVTVHEVTATYVKGELDTVSKGYWSKCHLMTSDGQDLMFSH